MTPKLTSVFEPEAPDPASPSAYTAKQYAALPALRDPRTVEGNYAARAEFANKVMAPDGTIVDNVELVRAATVADAADRAVRAAEASRTLADAKAAAAADPANPALASAQVRARDAARRAEIVADQAAGEARNFQGHLDEGRFLFIVDEFARPQIYFQCAVPGNPDVHIPEKEAQP